MHRVFGLAALAGAIVPSVATAQIPLTPRALGMGGAYVATARGFESIFYNPANLALPGSPGWSVSFPQVTVGSSVLGPDVADLPDFLDYDNLSQERRQELLATIPGAGTSVDVDVRAPLASVQIGRFGVGLAYGWMGEHTLGRDLVELFFEGYDPERFDYRVGNTVGTRASFWDVAAGYGHQVGPVSVGVTGHYYIGRGLVRTRAFEPRYTGIAVLRPDIEVDYVGVSSDGGSGFGLDVGVAMQPMPGLTLSAALANLVSSMSWDEELTGRMVTLTRADFESSEPANLVDRYEASERSLGTTPDGRFAEVAPELDREQWDLPTTLRLGAAWAAPTGTEIGLAYHNAVREGLLGGRWEQLLGVGISQKIPLLTLRAGASTNLSEGSMIGGGLRLGVIDLGVAKFTTGSTLDDSDRDGWAASFSVNVGTRPLPR